MFNLKEINTYYILFAVIYIYNDILYICFLGQALAIRTDLINEVYALEFRKLQDAVPPFDSKLAKETICRELGIKQISDRFLSISEYPIASASIGQVYKATLLNGQEVAVKVQRPQIIRDISLDLHILRLITPS